MGPMKRTPTENDDLFRSMRSTNHILVAIAASMTLSATRSQSATA